MSMADVDRRKSFIFRWLFKLSSLFVVKGRDELLFMSIEIEAFDL